MTKRTLAAAASLALLTVGLLAGCVAQQPAPGEPVAPATSPSGEQVELAGETTVYGTVTELSEPNDSGFYLLRVIGQGTLPLTISGELGFDPTAAGVVVAVPADFDQALDAAERYAALNSLAESTGQPLVVLRYSD